MPRAYGTVSVFFATLIFSAHVAAASTQTISANISFQSALILSPVRNIDVGTVLADASGVYTIDTQGTVTASAGGQVLGGTPEVGEITIAGSDTQTINISVTNYQTDSGVTPSNASCSYDGIISSPCTLSSVAAPAAGTSLLLGVTLSVDGTQSDGTQATPSFDVVVSYT